MCDKIDYHHMYLDDKGTMKRMFPEYKWEEQLICEKCAQRELGKKEWERIKQRKITRKKS